MQYTVASYIAETVAKTGMGRIYGVIGTSIIDFIDALYDMQSKLSYISTRHEQVAASAADAEARISGRPGYATVHAGPGLLNAVLSIGVAYRDRSPLFIISGGVRRKLYGTGAWLEIDQQSSVAPITMDRARLENPRSLPAVMKRLLASAMGPPRGPVLLEVPEDLWKEEVPEGEPPSLKDILKPPQKPSESEVRGSITIIKQAERPLILAGGEVNRPGCQEVLHQLAEALDGYIVTSGNGRGACDEAHPRCLGRVGFGGGSLPADRALSNADLVISLGPDLDDITTYSYHLVPRGEVITVSHDPIAWERLVPASLEISADPLEYAKALLNEIKRQNYHANHEEWTSKIEAWREEWNAILQEAASREYSGHVNPNRFFDWLGKNLPDDAIIIAGQGTHIVYTYSYIKIRRPRSFLAATNLGAMSFALPAGLGASFLAGGERKVLAVVGDGEIMMTIQDLETVARHRVPVKIIVVNDNSYRVLLLRQIIQKRGRIIGTIHTNPDFAELARIFGIEARAASSDEEAVKYGKEMLESEEPFLLELRIPRQDMPPLNLDATLKM